MTASLKIFGETFQFIIGNNLKSCLDALHANSDDSLHLLERINIDLQFHTSIVPTVLNLPRFKMSGKLPSLQVNFSDSKYKSLLRLIDMCIPNFVDEGDDSAIGPLQPTGSGAEAFKLRPTLFGQPETEYGFDDDVEDADSGDSLFFEADDGSTNVRYFHIFKDCITYFVFPASGDICAGVRAKLPG